MSQTRQRMAPGLGLALLAAIALAGGGCVSAGLAMAGPLVSGLQMLMDRSIERTLPAELGTAWAATVDGLQRMGIHIDQGERPDGVWFLKGHGEHVTVEAQLERVTARMTRISVRTEAGKLLADKTTGEEIMNQIGASLDRMVASPAPQPAAWSFALGELQQEMRRLRTSVEERQTPLPEQSVPSTPPAPSVTGVFVVPVSLGVPVLSAPAEAASRRVLPDGPVHAVSGNGAFGAPARPQAPVFGPKASSEPDGASVLGVLPAPLEAAGVLEPAEPLAIRPGSR